MNEQRILILPPSRRDGNATRGVLERAGLTCEVCPDGTAAARQIELGAAALIATDAALVARGIDAIVGALERQPAWSDLAVILLCHDGSHTSASSAIVGAFTNVTILDRPTSARTLISTAKAALRGRVRQYQTRDQLEALRVAEESLRSIDRRKDEFLAMLAHELRNPLAPIRNAAELLSRMQPENADVQAVSGIVKRQITHLSRLVDDLLDVSRITLGRIELQQGLVDLSDVISQALESVEPLMSLNQHKVHVAGRDGPLFVRGDHARLVQCIANILTNSAKYTDRGGDIRIDVERNDGRAIIRIADNGVGIPAELLPQIFDLFVQSDRSLDRSQGGLGIGLSVVRRLIEMHGGKVSAASAGVGGGATFEVELPVIPRPGHVSPQRPASVATSRRILIVDDNADSADSMAMVLRLAGHQVECVYSAEDALQRVSGLDPEVILLDIGLPTMNGYEVAKRLRARGGSARLVAVTGYGKPEDVRRAREAGFDAHLVKPVDISILFQDLGQA